MSAFVFLLFFFFLSVGGSKCPGQSHQSHGEEEAERKGFSCPLSSDSHARPQPPRVSAQGPFQACQGQAPTRGHWGHCRLEASRTRPPSGPFPGALATSDTLWHSLYPYVSFVIFGVRRLSCCRTSRGVRRDSTLRRCPWLWRRRSELFPLNSLEPGGYLWTLERCPLRHPQPQLGMGM